MEVTLPDQLARQVSSAVSDGWFSSENEVMVAALREFLAKSAWKLSDEHQLSDIEWAVSEANSVGHS